MTEQTQTKTDSEWARFIRKHKVAFAAFIAAGILAAISAVYVFVWFTGNAQSTGLVPATLGMWTIGNIVTFILHAIFWEFVLIGIPVAIGAVAAWQWWKRLPEEEKSHLAWKQSRSRDAGGAISPLLFIAFALKVYVDGNWNVAFATWTFDYLVYSYLWALIWILIIFGIPVLLGGTWWIRREMKKKP